MAPPKPSATVADELSSPEHCDYLYFGRGLTREQVPNPAATVLACDRTGNHKRFWNMVFVDGHVMGFSGDDFAAAVRRNNLTVPAEALGTGTTKHAKGAKKKEE